MRSIRCLAVAGLLLGLGAGAALAQEGDGERIREELIRRLDAKLERLRTEMVEEIDRALERRGDAPVRRVQPQPSGDGTPRLGVTLKPLTEGARTLLGLEEGIGVMIEEVAPGSSAAKAGIVAGDVLLTWNDTNIAGPEELGRLVRGSKVGDTVEITLLHRGEKKTVEATLQAGGAAPAPRAVEPARPERGEENLEDFLERVLKNRQGGEDDEGEDEGDEGGPSPFGFGGNPEGLQKMMEKMFSDPEAMRQMQEQAEEMMKQMFGGDPEKMEEFQKQAQDMMRQLFQGEGGEGGQDLRKMLERMMGGQGGGDEKEPGRQEEMDRLNKMLDDVMKGAKGEPKEEKGEDAPKQGAFLGVSFRPVSPAVRTQMNIEEGTGLLVGGLLEDGPAAKAGIEKFDIVVSIDGKKIGSVDDVGAALASRKAGDEVVVGLVRKGTAIEKTVTLGAPR